MSGIELKFTLNQSVGVRVRPAVCRCLPLPVFLALLESLVLLLLLPAADSYAGSPGTSGATFLKIGAGPRAEAMGEAHTAVADDSYAAYWNPAGLGQIEYSEAGFAFNRHFQDVNQQVVNFVKPFFPGGRAVSFSLCRLSVESFPSYNSSGVRSGEVGSSDWSVGVAYGRQFLIGDKASISAGAGVKEILESLGPVSDKTFAFDAGLLFRVSRFAPKRAADGLRFGLAFQNLGPALRYDSDPVPLPFSLNAGLAYETKIFGDKFTFALDQHSPNDHPAYRSLGAEYWLRGLLAVRAGFKSGQDEGSGFRGGIGLKIKFMELNYSFSPFGSLGSAHRIGLSMRFGAPVEITRAEPKTAEEFVERGISRMNDGRYYESILDFNQALESDPGNRRALELMRQAHEKMKKKQ